MNYKTIIFSFLSLVLAACGSETKTDSHKENTKPVKSSISIISPLNKAKYICGDTVAVNFRVKDTLAKIDSINLLINNKIIAKFEKNENSFLLPTANFSTGEQLLTFHTYKADSTSEVATNQFILMSNIVPERKSYKIIATYAHDPKAYTQGLHFSDGFLYESTGQYNESSLRKVDIKTGEVLQSLSLPDEVFGEGLCMFEDKIFQLTWRSQQAYVYDRKNFQLLYTFNYPINIEGWGIALFQNKLIVSDGSNKLYFIDPATFSLLHTIEVYDNKQKIDKLNELEVIDNHLFSNIYGTELIVEIDPLTGKVISIIDFSGIKTKLGDTKNIDVMNGIAYSAADKKIYITGKYWSKLFEVAIH